MQIILETTAGPHRGKRTVVRAGQTLSFGRTEQADVALPLDQHMSRVHFQIACDGLSGKLRDLGSANGTQVNGRRVTESDVNDADVIAAGASSFAVRFDAGVAERQPLPDYLKDIVPAGASAAGDAAPPATVEQFELQNLMPCAAAPGLSPAQPTLAFAPPSPAQPSEPAAGFSPRVSGELRLILVATAGPHVGARIAVRQGEAVKVGRGDSADLSLPRDVGLSGLHFSIQSRAGGFDIADLASTNGTLLNDEKVAVARLGDGDQITAGQSRFKIYVEGRAVASTADLQDTSPISFTAGLLDPDPGVRRAALFAAIWTAQRWLLPFCRKQAENAAPENWDAIHVLAMLGKPEDVLRIDVIRRAETLGPRRFLVCGTYGHPALVESLLEVMSGDDPAAAIAARLAFEKIAGVDVSSSERAAVVFEEGGPPSELNLPDANKARAHWKQVEGEFANRTRNCRGFDLGDEVSDEIFAQLDMESRYEIRLRGRYYGTWQGSLRELGAV